MTDDKQDTKRSLSFEGEPNGQGVADRINQLRLDASFDHNPVSKEASTARAVAFGTIAAIEALEKSKSR